MLKLIDKANGYLFGDMARAHGMLARRAHMRAHAHTHTHTHTHAHTQQEREKRSHNLLYNVDNIRGTSEPDYTRTMEVQEDYMREVAPSHRPSLPARDIVPMRIPVPVSENEGLQQPSNQPSKICWNCMRVEGTHRCTACKAAYYCSRTCQSTHWQQHKSRCKLLQNSAASAAAAGAKITLNDDNN